MSDTKRKRVDPVDIRVAAMNTKLRMPMSVDVSLGKIRALIQECAKQVADTVRDSDNGDFDMGRLIHTMDLMQQAKDTASMSLILPLIAKDGDQE